MLVAVLAFGLIKVRVSSSEVRVSSSGYRSTYLLYLLGGDLEELDDLRVILPDGPVQRRVPGLCGGGRRGDTEGEGEAPMGREVEEG